MEKRMEKNSPVGRNFSSPHPWRRSPSSRPTGYPPPDSRSRFATWPSAALDAPQALDRAPGSVPRLTPPSELLSDLLHFVIGQTEGGLKQLEDLQLRSRGMPGSIGYLHCQAE